MASLGKLHPKWKDKKNKIMSTKVHVHAQCFSVSFPAWEHLLKFDTTDSYSYYCVSAKVEELIHGDCMGPYICHQEFTVAKLAILTWR